MLEIIWIPLIKPHKSESGALNKLFNTKVVTVAVVVVFYATSSTVAAIAFSLTFDDS